MAVGQCYGRRKRDQELMLYRCNLKGLLGIRRMDGVLNGKIREFCGVTKGLEERINEGVLWWFSHVKRME